MKEELTPIIETITTDYKNNYIQINHDLNQAVYYLHFLADDTIHKTELQDLCESLYRLSESFYEAHKIREIKNQITDS